MRMEFRSTVLQRTDDTGRAVPPGAAARRSRRTPGTTDSATRHENLRENALNRLGGLRYSCTIFGRCYITFGGFLIPAPTVRLTSERVVVKVTALAAGPYLGEGWSRSLTDPRKELNAHSLREQRPDEFRS